MRRSEALVASMQQLPASSLRVDLGSILTSRRIFHGNHAELMRALQVTDDPGQWLPLMDITEPERFAQFRDELDRLLHNYLSSAYTLSSTEFSVAARRWPKGTADREAYERTTPYNKTGSTAFVFGLRHATQHERIPFTWASWDAAQVSPGGWQMDARFVLPRDELKKLDWSRSPVAKAGREYLESLSSDPDLRQIVEAFSTEAWSFAGWMQDRFQLVYREEFRAWNAAAEELANLSLDPKTG